MKRTSLFRLAVLFVWVCNASIFGGSMEPSGPPPVGSTTGTMKPLDQVEPRIAITSVPYTISASGSYYLTKSMSCSSTAITVASDDVTIDLCGYTITGPSTGTNYGISIIAHNNVETRNGAVRGFYLGICSNSGSNQIRTIGVRSVSNTCGGIYMSGNNCVVKDCTTSDNGGSATGECYGIYGGQNDIITGNTVYHNGYSASASGVVYGIYADAGSIVSGNAVSYNGLWAASGSSVFGINVVAGCTVSGNTLVYNGGGSSGTSYAIYSGYNGCKISDNTIKNAQGTGISAGTYAIVSGNAVSVSTGTGISIGDHSSATGNIATQNTLSGINTGNYCTISKCTANGNTQHGINAVDNCTITDCTASGNQQNGITAGSHVTITGNSATSNAVWGIYCTGGYIARNTASLNNTANTTGKGGIYVFASSQVRENTLEGNNKNNIYIGAAHSSVEGNVMSGSDYGIYFVSGGNFYANNRATANGTNYNPAGSTDGGGNISF